MAAFKPTSKKEKDYKFKDHLPITFTLTAMGIALVLVSFVNVGGSDNHAPMHKGRHSTIETF